MIEDRIEELTSFLSFVSDNMETFSSDGVYKFFDGNLGDTKVGDIINKLSKVDTIYVAAQLKKLYPETFSKVFKSDIIGPILDFKQKIDTSLKFC